MAEDQYGAANILGMQRGLASQPVRDHEDVFRLSIGAVLGGVDPEAVPGMQSSGR